MARQIDLAKERDQLRDRIEDRAHGLAEQLLRLDRKYHDRVATLQASGVNEFAVTKDVLLAQLSGATKTVSDMLAAMSTYLLATRPAPLPGSRIGG